MIKINKGRTPAEFWEIKKKCEHYDDLHNDDKAPLKEILIEEQGGICAYCMGRINAENSTIEHYIPRNGENGDPDKSLDYDNLFAVCNTTRNMPYEKQTCDVRKGGKLLHLDPRKQSDIDSIKYTK
jgi:uncharacterized protein (TIGR02646 family)